MPNDDGDAELVHNEGAGSGRREEKEPAADTPVQLRVLLHRQTPRATTAPPPARPAGEMDPRGAHSAPPSDQGSIRAAERRAEESKRANLASHIYSTYSDSSAVDRPFLSSGVSMASATSDALAQECNDVLYMRQRQSEGTFYLGGQVYYDLAGQQAQLRRAMVREAEINGGDVRFQRERAARMEPLEDKGIYQLCNVTYNLGDVVRRQEDFPTEISHCLHAADADRNRALVGQLHAASDERGRRPERKRPQGAVPRAHGDPHDQSGFLPLPHHSQAQQRAEDVLEQQRKHSRANSIKVEHASQQVKGLQKKHSLRDEAPLSDSAFKSAIEKTMS
ncbi:hypothetical protein CYMTET_33096 [Cymbomonas tetramitiformis]|uniref:Uncharacterized protein n=1 Tax=Cymbomonas tetramitiformis TaxID=36881 RepID=A0AAE0FE52_9CHLO|nr:hypothetical protein CYMTET_33096 [Cymbomonas tetramitiformis]